jgi:hypothetical protein
MHASVFLRANDVRSVQNKIGDFRAIDVRGGRLKINQKAGFRLIFASQKRLPKSLS